MKKSFIHKYNEFSNATVEKRINTMIDYRNELTNNGVENLHVKFSTGNRKTGAAVPSVSLIPVADCGNCKVCANGCYDVRNVCFQKTVQRSRANNSALYHQDPKRYFSEIKAYAKKQKFFRWHVGGDLVNRSYFLNVVAIATECTGTQFLLFTKLYGVVNKFIEAGGVIPENLHVIFSDWRGAQFDNRYNLPVSSPVWVDKEGKETERGPHCTNEIVWCGGDCTQCATTCAGCFGLKKGQTVLFEAH